MKAHFSNLPSLSSPHNSQTIVNPLVRVAYTRGAYLSQNSVFQIFLERVVGPYVALAYDIRDWWVQCKIARDIAERREKVREWERVSGEVEVGEYCLIDQMQLLMPWGWAHI